jgi:vancomycin permeability regulator SanA
MRTKQVIEDENARLRKLLWEAGELLHTIANSLSSDRIVCGAMAQRIYEEVRGAPSRQVAEVLPLRSATPTLDAMMSGGILELALAMADSELSGED